MKSKMWQLFCLLLILAMVPSCRWSRREPLHEPAYTKTSTTNDSQLLVIFSESVTNRPLDETVWDNVSGPFWDVKESHQIGFTQNYQPQFYLMPPALLPLAAKSGAHLVDSRLVVPFGRIFARTVQSAANKSFTHVFVAYDQSQAALITNKYPVDFYLKVGIENFLVWENPLNHINFHIKIHGEMFDAKSSQNKACDFERDSLENDLGGVFSTHASLIAKMNETTNRFAEETVTEMLLKFGIQ